MWDFVIEGIVDFFVGGSIVQGVLSHFCPNEGVEGRRFTQEAHHIHVGGWIEFHETHVEGKFNIVSVHAHGFGGRVGLSIREDGCWIRRIRVEWLHWQQHQLADEDDYIQHAGNFGEYRILHSQYTVDRYHEKTNTVYEFQGCFWHGCPVCYSNHTESHRHLDDRCFDDVYRCAQVKLDLLHNRGFRVVKIWECQSNWTRKGSRKIPDCVRWPR